MLYVSDCEVKIRSQQILKNISFQLHKGKITTLVGHNGAGKSMLIKAQ
ncbi:ATP-binding cassette domain-containing protein [Halobacillus amylolyticus]|uniref:ATP-binding cassette domain-containing protein n=1 Tax=Halobacillus amylolyticus TaxID=2932259 RepID=A0ABY4HGW0_9BACI|nr:ATP-binding cassette domain-containing protein [Halobacillus amylolyticus]UOR14016.1 ATP-binding cassette domain-containing protein [Halobacillus amylolyticus]